MSNVSGSDAMGSHNNIDNGYDAAQPAGFAFPYWAVPVLAAWAHAAWLFGRLPASVPVHWNFAGQVDRYGGPAEAAFLLPGIMTLTAVLMAGVLPLFIPSAPNYAGTRRVYLQLVAIVMGFLLYLQVVVSQLFMGATDLPLIGLVVCGAGVMFILMGNLLPKLKRNPIAGARLPSVMHDDVAWTRAQRATGLAFVLLGALLVIASPLRGWLPLYVLLLGKALVVGGVLWYLSRKS